MPQKNLALTIAGAVSLGSYEAGAMYEILDAIRQHNENAQTRTNGDFVRVDVITGASAGGMTGAILAQRLLYQKDDFRGPYDNPLYDTWVKQISMQGLTSVVDKPIDQKGDLPATFSLFSSALIERIAQHTLCKTDGSGDIPLRGGAHNAIDPARGLRLGLALTNVNGINYGIPMFDTTEFQYTDFSDRLLRLFSQNDRSLGPWAEISKAAVACGAFPLAFRTKELVRNFEEYDPEDHPNLEQWPDGAKTWRFTYTDGGVLQNQPLGMAKKLVDSADDHRNQENRFYLFVSPEPMSGLQDLMLREGTTDIGRLARRLVDIYMGQAVLREWIKVKGINKKLEILDLRIKALADALEEGALSAEALLRISRAISQNPAPDERSGRAQAKALSRLAAQYADELESVGGPETSKGEAILNAALVLEETAGLGDYDQMRVYGLVTEHSLLAGAGIFAFVGFMAEAYRNHDYDRGRLVAQALLAKPDFQKPGELGPLRYTPSPVHRIDTDLDGLHLDEIHKSDVRILKSGLTRRVRQIVDELEPSIGDALKRAILLGGADLLIDLLIDWEFSRNVQGASNGSGQSPTGRKRKPSSTRSSAKSGRSLRGIRQRKK
jgi:hypothetical protein